VATATVGSAIAIVAGGRNAAGAAPIVYLSPAGSDSNSCTRERPCLSFGRVWNDSTAGQVVEVAAGTYGRQELGPYLLGAARAPVVFRPAPGARVTVGEVIVKGSHLEFRDMRFGGWSTSAEARNVTFRRITSKNLFIWSSTNIRVLGGSVGPGQGLDYDPQLTTASGSRHPPTNILIDGVRFHDWWRPAGSDFHTECLQVGSGVNVVIRNSRFERCSTHDIFIRSWGDTNGGAHPIRGWLIEKNRFGATLDGYFALQLAEGATPGQPCENVLIRNNSSRQSMHIACPAGGAKGVRIESNILPEMRSYACGLGGSRWDYNVYRVGTRCGAHDRVDAGAYDGPAKPSTSG
jgi:hypothetical protein